jgi:parallel beta-helix repeat protein
LLEDRTMPSAYVVTTTADSGPGSLRDAINQINADTNHVLYASPSNPNVDEIDFNITAGSDTGGGFNAGTGVATIMPLSPLPAITNAVLINGYTQAGASQNTLLGPCALGSTDSTLHPGNYGDNAVLKIELNGANALAGPLYVGNYGDQTIGTYNPSTGLGINPTLITGPAVQDGLAFDSLGHLYAAGWLGGTVGDYSAGTGAPINSSLITGLNFPAGLALDGSGHLFVAIQENGPGTTVGEYDANTGGPINANFITGLSCPTGLALDGSGHLYVANYLGNSIGEYDASTGAPINANLITVANPYALALDAFGNIYVSNPNTGVIGEYNANTGAPINANLITIPNNQRPAGLALDGSGHLYVANYYGNDVGEYDANAGAPINATLITGLDGPTSLAFDSAGNANSYGLYLSTGNVTVQGLVINNFASGGINVNTSGPVTIQGNFLGTDVTGTVAEGNGGADIWGGSYLTIGGSSPAARNVISGAYNVSPAGDPLNGFGVSLSSGPQDVVQGNFIGTDVTGTKSLGNANDGIHLFDNGNNLIGGTVAGAGNLMSGNGANGIGGGTYYAGDFFEDNFIGTDVTGTKSLPNALFGIAASTLFTTAGETIGAPGAGNLISGNGSGGIYVGNDGCIFQGNFIGTDVTGNYHLGNNGNGIQVDGNNHVIGGTQPGDGNTIAYNSSYGVALLNSGGPGRGVGNSILGNSISANDGPGIFLDSATNANDNQTAPTLIAATTHAGNTYIGGALASVPNTTFRVEFFSNASSDTDQGQTYLGFVNVTTDSAGNADFLAGLTGVSASQRYISATATRLSGSTLTDTSAFSNDVNAFASPSAYVVTTSADGGPGSLRDAINQINADTSHTLYASPSNPNVDEIDFNITASSDTGGGFNAGTGVATIAPLSALPAIANSVVVDGYTQTGASPNTLTVGDNAVLKVELDGANTVNTDGLVLGADNITVLGLVINRFGIGSINGGPEDADILAQGAGDTIQGNLIGTDTSGTNALANADGIITSGAPGKLIGGTDPAARNIISSCGSFGPAGGAGIAGNGTGVQIEGNYIGTDITGTKALPNFAGVWLHDENAAIGGTAAGDGNVISGNGIGIRGGFNSVQGNLIGTDCTGTRALGNDSGFYLEGAQNLVIGGTVLDGHGNNLSRNVISGNNIGIYFLGASGNLVEGNFIGTDIAGTEAIGGAPLFGVFLSEGANNNVIGGTIAAARNIISGFGGSVAGPGDSGYTDGAGIFIGCRNGNGSLPSGNLVEGNYIGTDVSGSLALGNYAGVTVDGGINNVIGGTFPGDANIISSNAYGVAMGEGINNGVLVVSTGSAVLGNSITGNAFGGIQYLANGSNNNQAAPVLTAAISSAAGTAISGTLAAYPSTSFRIEFFSNQTPDPSGYGEGQTFLGFAQVTTDSQGNFSANLPTSLPLGTFLSATATNAAGDTSGFAADITVKAALTLVTNSNLMLVGNNPPPLTGSVNGTPFTSPFQYTTPLGDTFTITLSTTATSASAVGQYPIMATVSGPNLGNYVILPNYGTMYVASVGVDPTDPTHVESVVFWDNNHNAKQITLAELQSLDSLHLVDGKGNPFDPSTLGNLQKDVNQLQQWLQAPPKASTSYQLSVQLASMDLNVLSGYVHATDLVFAGGLLSYASAYGITGLTSGGFIDVQNLMNAANAILGQVSPGSQSSDPNQAYEMALAQVLQAANANGDFVSQEMLWGLVGLYPSLT